MRRCLRRLSLAATVCIAGCGETSTPVVTAEVGLGSGAGPERPKPIALEHDLGQLRPGMRVTQAFTVRNETASGWTLKRIEKRCNCAVASISQEHVASGDDLRVDLAYVAGSKNRDDRQTIMLEFEQPSAPRVFLTVTARIRRALSADRDALELRIARGQPAETEFRVFNFGPAAWRGLSISAPVEWISAQPVPIGSEANLPTGARQGWIVSVNIGADLAPGKHRCVLNLVAAAGTASVAETLPVAVEVESPVAVIPSEFFIGDAPVDQAATKSILLRFAPNAVPASFDDVIVQHDLGDELFLEWSRASDSYWKLQATFSADGTSDLVSGTISVAFPKADLPNLEIPFRAIVRLR